MAMVEPLNPENGGNKSAEKSCQKPSLGARRRFSDITNLSRVKTEVKNENAKPILMFNTDMMEQVHKENAALLGLLAQRDETIKLCRLELQKVRSELLKTNWHLAQVNSQTLAELNITKEKMKLLQHEHGIVTGMLKAKNAELENKVKTLSQELHTLRKINKDEHTQCGELIINKGKS
ncbi:SHUGOSHIN 1-like [Amborella trichopoda]|uniref:SHUGOSHIN 1-like n=1 Tax=Amborella trichopoda TaxID=13333 RepID=UPI0005D40811|nr:SHUGOSHIN 1-like [Amborella trichopoda]XP_020517925.1 SHUGOSHIN 1-like [Amborella trichopoda]XP_020517926.1 SHUGOSHIN 1-like [Amborella trichopoda]|eukprot:XP_011620364.1 SHUGOSHIN 1-like [Amborella trichopoda]